MNPCFMFQARCGKAARDDMKIPIPEVDERFDSIENALEHFIRLCNVIVGKAKEICPEPAVNDITAYALAFIQKVMQQASTLVIIARKREDYNTVCALVRMQADNIAAINLIYNATDNEEKVLRHLLYVMDGISDRYDMLAGTTMSYDGKIPRETYDALYKQVQDATDNAAHCLVFCESEIKKRPGYAAHPSEVEALIQNRNWKFREIIKPKQAYKWKELYERLDIKRGVDIFPYLSQYVHGLSISNIILNNPDDFDAPLSFEACLLGWLLNYLRKVYEPHIGEYTWEDIKKVVPDLFGNNTI